MAFFFALTGFFAFGTACAFCGVWAAETTWPGAWAAFPCTAAVFVPAGFGVPTEEELRHDYLWRIHAAVPGKGRIGVFNRSHYEDVLVVRVNELVPREVWERRYDQINAFEAHLAANGTRILKFYLHVSRDEQRRRLEKRLRNPTKYWKWSSGDLEVRERWSDYLDAYTDALARCSTEVAPWFVIPADRKWYRNLAVAEIVAQTAAAMNPQWPAAEDGMEDIEIPA